MDDGSVAMSVGRALERTVAFSINHPLYQGVTQSMEKKVAELSAVRGAMKASATLAVVTVALPSDDLATLVSMFPEFKVVNFGSMRPAHALFTQFRRMAVDWLLLQATKTATSAICFGSPLMAALECDLDSVMMMVDPVNPLAVHERHSVSLDAFRVYGDYVEASKAAGHAFSRTSYDRHLVQEGVRFCAREADMGTAEVVCVDGVMYSYSPWQVAAAMVAGKADVAFGFFPYHPTMLTDVYGELPGFGVEFARGENSILFKYPEGVAGVASYPLEVWRAWLCSHHFSIGSKRKQWFQLELLKHRGPVMFYRVVRLPAEPEEKKVSHALELPGDVPSYVVTSWRLRSEGLVPSDRRSWEVRRYVVAQRLVDRVYQFAMQLPKEQFTRYAIRKQLRVVNDRVTVEGTSVKVNSALGERMIDALVIDIFSRVFVDRYKAGTVTSAMKKYVDEYVGFSQGDFVSRIRMVGTLCAMSMWEATFSPVNSYIRDALDAVRRFFSPKPHLSSPQFEVAPGYVLVGDMAKAVVMDGGEICAAELGRRAAMQSSGFFSEVARTFAQLQGPKAVLSETVFRVESFALFPDGVGTGTEVEDTLSLVRAINAVDESPIFRRALEVTSVHRLRSREQVEDFNPLADPVYTLNEFYSEVLPGVAEQNLEYDTASVSLDPQDRTLAAPYLRLPKYFGDVPKSKSYYRSRLRALNVPKRQQTLQELLSAMAARNLNAPQVALPQDDAVTARAVWENFLETACVPGAREMLRGYARDKVGIEEEAFREWGAQSDRAKVEAVRKELLEKSQALAEMDVGDYLVMLKSDVKPTLSQKPLDTRTEPQVIVYHEKALSSLYSCMFRVLVRRFLALLKPNYHVNLLKDTRDIEDFLRGVHPYVRDLRYLENDFSKYDKSQGRFVFVLEELVFAELGLNQEFLAQWLGGHVECHLRAVSLGLSLHVLYQRKSGDATTAFGNVILNVLSVSYAYRGTEVVWALFMGDDSLMCCTRVAHEDEAVNVLAEVFNLGAKTYLTESPYYASNFVVIDDFNKTVYLVPDPVKRIERWSMAISAEDPQWKERYISARDAMSNYLNCAKAVLLPKMISDRYCVRAEAARGVADAVATVLNDQNKFRSMWEECPHVSNY